MVLHKHHILPKHAGGSDDPSNILLCTVPVHAYLHRIRYCVHGNEYDRIAADSLSGMIGREEVIHQMLASRTGDRNPFYGKHHTPEALEKIGKASSRKVVSDRVKEKMSAKHSGKGNPMYGVRSPMKGKQHTEEAKRKVSEANTGTKAKRKTCSVCGKDVAINILAQFHEDKCKWGSNDKL